MSPPTDNHEPEEQLAEGTLMSHLLELRSRIMKAVLAVIVALLGLMPFFTVGPDECRAWTIRQGATAVEAAGEIHTDIQRGFIRAEVVGYDAMIEHGTMAEVRKAGEFRREGKTYVVKSGDIINFLFNV